MNTSFGFLEIPSIVLFAEPRFAFFLIRRFFEVIWFIDTPGIEHTDLDGFLRAIHDATLTHKALLPEFEFAIFETNILRRAILHAFHALDAFVLFDFIESAIEAATPPLDAQYPSKEAI